MTAKQMTNYSIMSLLVGFGARVNETDDDGNTALSLAAENGNSDLVRLLISRGAHRDHQNNRGLTPLSLAASKLKYDTVSCLLDLGAEISVRDLYGLACERNTNSLKYLRSIIPFDAIIEDFTGSSALHWAACDNNTDAMEVLLETGLCEVEDKNDNDLTPLHVAARHDNLEAVEYLVSKGANVFAKDACEKTPLKWAIMWRNMKVIKILNEAMYSHYEGSTCSKKKRR